MAKETRKKRQGKVVRNSMDKTVIVAVEWRQRHPLYKKSVRRISRFFVHDAENRCVLGDVVRIEETRPISRLKRWRVVQVLEQHEVAEVQPIELDQAVLAEVSEITETTELEEAAELDGTRVDLELPEEPEGVEQDREAVALAELEALEALGVEGDEEDDMVEEGLNEEEDQR